MKYFSQCFLFFAVITNLASANNKGGLCPSGSINDKYGEVCCPESCGSCGGFGCHLRPGGANNCCSSSISRPCKSNQPPCSLITKNTPTPAPTTAPVSVADRVCVKGGIPSDDKEACCPSTCGTCGGYGCNKKPGGDTDCCPSKFERSCTKYPPPCLNDDGLSSPEESPCPPGSAPDTLNRGCCPNSCGLCGGFGCQQRPGGADDCCPSVFEDSCSTSSPPCLI